QLSCLDQPVAKAEGDELKVGLDEIEIRSRERCEKTVAKRCMLKVGHGSLPHGGKSASPLEPSLSRLRPRSPASSEPDMGNVGHNSTYNSHSREKSSKVHVAGSVAVQREAMIAAAR